MRKCIFLAVLVLTLVTALTAHAEIQAPMITTTGQAIVYVVPDRVILTLGVQSYDPNLDRARDANAAAGAKLVKAIADLGVAPRDIATDNLQVEISYKSDHYGTEIEGYTLRRGYAVTLRDPKLFEKLVDTAIKNGANQIHGADFQTSDLRKYRDQARQMAIKAAREKAADLAKELDVAVGKPLSITEGGNYYYAGYYFGRNSLANAQVQANGEAVAPANPDTSDSLPLGQIAVNATITVSFELK